MLCLGPKKSLPSPRLELAAQGVAYRCLKVECEDHSAIQAPYTFEIFKYKTFKHTNLGGCSESFEQLFSKHL